MIYHFMIVAIGMSSVSGMRLQKLEEKLIRHHLKQLKSDIKTRIKAATAFDEHPHTVQAHQESAEAFFDEWQSNLFRVMADSNLPRKQMAIKHHLKKLKSDIKARIKAATAFDEHPRTVQAYQESAEAFFDEWQFHLFFLLPRNQTAELIRNSLSKMIASKLPRKQTKLPRKQMRLQFHEEKLNDDDGHEEKLNDDDGMADSKLPRKQMVTILVPDSVLSALKKLKSDIKARVKAATAFDELPHTVQAHQESAEAFFDEWQSNLFRVMADSKLPRKQMAIKHHLKKLKSDIKRRIKAATAFDEDPHTVQAHQESAEAFFDEWQSNLFRVMADSKLSRKQKAASKLPRKQKAASKLPRKQTAASGGSILDKYPRIKDLLDGALYTDFGTGIRHSFPRTRKAFLRLKARKQKYIETCVYMMWVEAQKDAETALKNEHEWPQVWKELMARMD